IAHNNCCDSVPTRRVQPWVPRSLSIVVGMDVDEAGRYDLASCIDFLPTCARHVPDRSNSSVGDRYISVEKRTARAIGDVSIADYEVVLGCHWQCLLDIFAKRFALSDIMSRPEAGGLCASEGSSGRRACRGRPEHAG